MQAVIILLVKPGRQDNVWREASHPSLLTQLQSQPASNALPLREWLQCAVRGTCIEPLSRVPSHQRRSADSIAMWAVSSSHIGRAPLPALLGNRRLQSRCAPNVCLCLQFVHGLLQDRHHKLLHLCAWAITALDGRAVIGSAGPMLTQALVHLHRAYPERRAPCKGSQKLLKAMLYRHLCLRKSLQSVQVIAEQLALLQLISLAVQWLTSRQAVDALAAGAGCLGHHICLWGAEMHVWLN